ncbi:MAG TPA: class I SAM-dependent methyltransferase [Vicinamibacterales bacterium]|jgi:ubiquinone/menaquinone biosynthesis C-methylase UbiE
MTAAAKAYRGVGMEGPIATWYTKNTGRDLTRFRHTAQAIAARVPAGGRILEVAPGPGYLTIELASRGYDVSAVDISQSFVRIARENVANAGLSADIRHGDAAALPFGDDTFDAIVCTAAFKNFSDPLGAINEMYRTLKRGGEASVYDLRKEASREDVDAEVATMHLSAFNALMTRLTFRFVLLKRAYTRDAIREMAGRGRFTRYEIFPEGVGFELRLTKDR